MLVLTGEETRADLTLAITNLSHRAARVICTSPDHEAIHAEINSLLEAAGW